MATAGWLLESKEASGRSRRFFGEESPSTVGQRWWVTPTGPRAAGQGQCHRKQTADVTSVAGKVEKVR